ncbi:MAG TPA: ATP-binding protein [Candidatus Sulfotelmatobacter sp.]|nr:ATP-binding protein [Candidatus Sulfotelmatobacter sp.]
MIGEGRGKIKGATHVPPRRRSTPPHSSDGRRAPAARSSEEDASPSASAPASPAPRRRLSRELHELRGYYEDLLSSLEDGVIVLDPDGRLVWLNQAGEELTGFSAGQVRGRRVEEVFPPPAPLASLAGKTIGMGRSHADFDATVVRADGTRLAVSAVASLVSDPQGATRGIVLVLRDLSRVRDLEVQAHRADRLAALGILAAGMAHEVRNPLVGIRAAAQLLEKEPGFAGEWREFTGVIIRQVDRLNRLVDDLLAFAGQRPLARQPADVHQLLGEALRLEGPALQAAGIQVARQYDPALPAVAADPDRLLQVFLNLLRNGIEAMSDRRGTLSVRTRFERVAPQCGGRPAAVVEIQDQGPGIPPRVQAQLFNPFFTTKAKGSGLGLPISQRIVEEHGGAIEVQGREGEGAVFRVLLPIASEPGGRA